MVILRVKDRGRDIAVHKLEGIDEAKEVRRVYELLDYPPEKLIIEQHVEEQREAA